MFKIGISVHSHSFDLTACYCEATFCDALALHLALCRAGKRQQRPMRVTGCRGSWAGPFSPPQLRPIGAKPSIATTAVCEMPGWYLVYWLLKDWKDIEVG